MLCVFMTHELLACEIEITLTSAPKLTNSSKAWGTFWWFGVDCRPWLGPDPTQPFFSIMTWTHATIIII